ncbi:hypothetical protein ACFPM0_27305 [Pseudonocardia sulfidoxydans]|uniref:hypothetical protein n=1 Tax=Pseudonocardia sulfidoxydans TaxID=54011 RepID=UPI0036183D3D
MVLLHRRRSTRLSGSPSAARSPVPVPGSRAGQYLYNTSTVRHVRTFTGRVASVTS